MSGPGRAQPPPSLWGGVGRPTRRWAIALLAIVLGGLALRYIALAAAEPCRQPGPADLALAIAGESPGDDQGCVLLTDAPVYREQALSNAEGAWWQTAPLGAEGARKPSALHPPLYPLALTVAAVAGVEDFDALRGLAVLLGGATIALTGLLARRVGGDRAGLVAAALVAVHPMVWINDIVLMSEGLYAVWVPIVAWTAIVAWERRDASSAAVLGTTIGLAALTRSEAILLVGFIGIPLLLRKAPGSRSAWRRFSFVALAAAMTSALWVGPNLLRFNQPVLFTTTAGFSTAMANCEEVYEVGPRLGSRHPPCLQRASDAYGKTAEADDDQSDADASLRSSAWAEARRDPLGATTAAVTRVARMWGVVRPFETIRVDEPLERRGIGRSQAAVIAGWAVMLLGASGAMRLRRRSVPISPLAAWVATATVVALVNAGLHRFRAGADVALCVLAAIAIDHQVRAWITTRQRRDRAQPSPVAPNVPDRMHPRRALLTLGTRRALLTGTILLIAVTSACGGNDGGSERSSTPGQSAEQSDDALCEAIERVRFATTELRAVSWSDDEDINVAKSPLFEMIDSLEAVAASLPPDLQDIADDLSSSTVQVKAQIEEAQTIAELREDLPLLVSILAENSDLDAGVAELTDYVSETCGV